MADSMTQARGNGSSGDTSPGDTSSGDTSSGDTSPGDAPFDAIAAFARQFSTPEHQPFAFEHGADSPSALLLHGFPGTPAEMRPLGQALHDAGWTARGILLPGFGAEITRLADKTMEDWMAAARSALTRLQAERRPTLLIGHSMGGALAMQLAAELRPDALILISPFWTLDQFLWRTLPALKHLFPRVKPFRIIPINLDDPQFRKGISDFMPGIDWGDPQAREDVRRGMRDFAIPVTMLDQIRRTGEAAYAVAPQIACESLVLQGSFDPLVKPARTQRLIAQMAVPPAYYELAGEHNLPDATRPAYREVERRVLEFAGTVGRISLPAIG